MARYNDSDVQYEDLDSDGNIKGAKSIDEKAREPKTQLEKAAIMLFPRMKRFPSKNMHDKFRAFEAKTRARQGTEDHLFYLAYFSDVAKWFRAKNRSAIVINMHILLGMLHDNDRFLNFKGSKAAKDWVANYKKNMPGQAVRSVGRELEDE